MIKVSEIKKGMVFMRTHDGEYQYFAESDAYLRNGIWCVDIGDGYRYGNVKKTVVVICVDEDEFGLPVTEKWSIKKHREYAV